MTTVQTRIRIVSIPVSDQQRAKVFYVDQLGFELRAEAPFGEGQHWVEVAPPCSPTALALVTWFEDMPAGSLRGLVLECDDIHATFEELQRRGVSFTGPIEEQDWGTFAPFEDPDGNGWVLSA